jgi:hypothetical protein
MHFSNTVLNKICVLIIAASLSGPLFASEELYEYTHEKDGTKVVQPLIVHPVSDDYQTLVPQVSDAAYDEKALTPINIPNIGSPESWPAVQEAFQPVFVNEEVFTLFKEGFATLYAHSTPKHGQEMLLKFFQCLYVHESRLKAALKPRTEYPDEEEYINVRDNIAFQQSEAILQRLSQAGHKPVLQKHNPRIYHLLHSKRGCLDCIKRHLAQSTLK